MAQQVDSRQALRMLPADYASVHIERVEDTRTPEQIAEDNATAVQAQSEGVDLNKGMDGKPDRTVTLGTGSDEKRFRIADSVGLMPLMEFAYHANSGMDTSDMNALAAIYEMLKDCVHEDEWNHFRAHAKKIKADAEILMNVVQETVELLTARPTSQESVSSVPSRPMSDSLTDTSSGQRAQLVAVGDLGKVSSL